MVLRVSVSLLPDPVHVRDMGGSPLILRGDPGAGKTAMLEAAARQGRDQGLRVLRAAGVEAEAELPFSGLHQLLYPLREYIGRLPQAQSEALDQAFGLVEGPAPARFVISAAALALVDAAASDGPLLLLVDDVAWIDRSSAEVLGFVARRLADQPVVFLAAVGSDVGGTGHSAILTAGLPEIVLRPGTRPEPWPVEAPTPLRLVTPVPELTSQELRIADLAAQGLTNKQIGERLFLSHRTVGTHLYKLFPKLGISSRAALRDALEALPAQVRTAQVRLAQ